MKESHESEGICIKCVINLNVWVGWSCYASVQNAVEKDKEYH